MYVYIYSVYVCVCTYIICMYVCIYIYSVYVCVCVNTWPLLDHVHSIHTSVRGCAVVHTCTIIEQILHIHHLI